MDDMVCSFMHIATYRSWLIGGSTGKGTIYVSLKLRVVVKCGDPKLLENAMKSYPSAETLNTSDCALDILE